MTKRIDVIQLVRGIAALLVCIFHLKGLLNTSTTHYGTTLFGGGAIGVSLFFIISGFIMVYTTRKSDGSLLYAKNFMIKRLVRIIPLYYMMVLFWVFVYDTHLDYFSKDIMTLVKTFCFVPIFDSTIGPAYGMPPLKVGWSLNFEIFFYLIFGISLFMKRFRWVMLFAVFAGLVFVVPLLSRGYVSMVPSHNYQFRFLYLSLITNPMMLYFITGVALGLLYDSTFSIQSRWIKFGMLPLAVGLFLLLYFRVLPLSNYLLINLFICCLLVFGLLFFNKEKGIKVPAMFVYLGDMSYSLYLIHPTIVIALPWFLSRVGLGGKIEGIPYFFVLMACILMMSMLSYELIEKRLLKRLAKVLTAPRIKRFRGELQPIMIKE
jgi:exopolysaccharide production protein ExoZ